MYRKSIPTTLLIILTLLIAACSSGSEASDPVQSAQEQSIPTEAQVVEAETPAQSSDNQPAEQPAPDTASVSNLPGYTLFASNSGQEAFLIDEDGQVVHSWELRTQPGQAIYLMENGNLLASESIRSQIFTAGGSGGGVAEYDWDGNLLWSFDYSSDTVQQHHDVEMLPNGNVLLIAWESKTQAEALAAGRDPSLIPDENDGSLWPDHLIEIEPSSGEIVWEWHVWDHLIQDVDPSKDNYGVVAEHPELVDINYTGGIVGSDWNHTNSVDYNADLDQIVLSVHNANEIWIIDHATTTAEAAGPAGDLLYRWGNPAAYDTAGEQQLYVQHDAEWIAEGLSGAGNILIFNNGDRRTRPYSTIVEIETPLNADGSYTLTAGSAYGPVFPTWEYIAPDSESFYATNISGSQRLSNGNTLITDGPAGHFFEVTSAGDIVWQYTVIADNADEGGTIQVFRAERYAADYAGLAGRDLTLMGEVPPQTGRTPGEGGPGGGNGPPGGGPPNDGNGPPEGGPPGGGGGNPPSAPGG